MSFPTSLDSFTTNVDNVDVIYASDVNELQTAIEALEAKVGVDSSAVNTSFDFKLNEVTGGDEAVGKSATQTLTNKTLTSPTITTPVFNGIPSGTFVIPIENGGTGQTTANTSFNALVPSQTGNSGKYLGTDGSNTSWNSFPYSTSALYSNFEAGETLLAGDVVYIKNIPLGLTRDNSANAAALTTGFTSSFTVTTQANRLLLVHIHSDGGQDLSAATCTYGGQSMTLLRNFTGPGVYNSSVFGIIAPLTGANNISASWATGNSVQMKAISYYGVEQNLGNITNAAASGTGTAVSGNITTTVANDWIVTFGGHDGSSTSVSGTNCTMVQTGASSWVGDSNGPIATPASTAVTSTNGTSRGWEKCSFVIHQFRQAYDAVFKASASATATSNSTLGFSSAGYAAGETAVITTQGVASGLSGLTIGTQYYVSNTAGAVSPTAGTVTRKVGIATSATNMLITNIW